jgi:MTH538 TIR-like domain (DUF1863)
LTFLQKIRDAIHGADRMIVVIGPKAVTSDYVRAEWQPVASFIVPARRSFITEEFDGI